MICMSTGLIVCTNGNAQSIVGKWKGVSVTNYYSDAYAKQVGKTMEVRSGTDAGSSEIDYNADHSFTTIFYETSGSEATIMKGVWSTNGDQLTLTLDPQFNPQKKSTVASFSIQGNTMTTTATIAPPSRIIKTVSTATKL